MFKINLLFTNSYKITFEEIDGNTSIDSIKIKIFREYSDKLPIPSSVFIENEDNNQDEEKDCKKQDDYYTKLNSSIIHQDQLRLIFSGKQLENYSTLLENNIKDGDTILVAVSPFISNYKQQFQDKMRLDQEEISSNGIDKVYLGIPIKSYNYITEKDEKNEKPIFKLTINDRSYRQQLQRQQNQQKNSQLQILDDQETYKLLNRIESKDNNSNFDDYQKIYNSNNQNNPCKLIPITTTTTKTNNNNNNRINNQSLDTLLDRLSLHDIPSKEQITIEKEGSKVEVKKKLEIQTFIPVSEVSICFTISVIFNRPWLPLTNDLSSYEIPLIVEPKLPNGKWETIDGKVFIYKCKNPKASTDNTLVENLVELPLSTNYKVTVDSKRFLSLYNEEIDEKVYEFKTSPQQYRSVEFNNELGNPQIRISLSQPIKYSNGGEIAPMSAFDVKYIKKSDDGLFGNKGSNIMKSLYFKVLSNDDKANSFKQKFQENQQLKESSVVLLITSNIKECYGYKIQVDVDLSYFGSTLGKLFGIGKFPVTLYTQELLKITPDLLSKEQLSQFNKVSFTSTCQLQNFDFIELNKTKKLDQFIKIKPDIKIKDIIVKGTKIEIYSDFKPSKTYTVQLMNFKDFSEKQTINSNVTGFFSFPNIPQKIYHVQESNLHLNYHDNLLNEFYNLDPQYEPSINIYTEGIDNLLIKCFSINLISFNKIKRIDTKTIEIEKKLIKNEESGEFEEEKSTRTNIDLSKFFGGNSVKDILKHSILLFEFESCQDLEVKKTLILQYTPLIVSHFEIGREVSLLVSDSITNKQITDLSINCYNLSTLVQRKPTYNQEKKSFEKWDQFEVTHLAIQDNTDSNKKCVYNCKILKNTNKYQLKWDIIDSQGIYRPGDTVNIKGLLRLNCDSFKEQIKVPTFNLFKENGLLSESIKTNEEFETIKYNLFDCKKEILSGTTKLDQSQGSFEFNFEIPLQGNLGPFYLDFSFNDSKEKHYFQVQEFKRKQFLVESSIYLNNNQSDDKKPNNASSTDEPFSIEVLARSYTGEILPDTMIEWTITVKPTYDKVFNDFSNYKFYFDQDYLNVNLNQIKFNSSRLSSGKHRLDMVLSEAIYSCNITIDAIVIDVTNNREIISNSFFIKSNRLKYFGLLKELKPFVNQDEQYNLSLLLCDSNGKLAKQGKINLSIKRIPWEEDLPGEELLNDTILPENFDQESPIIKYQFQLKKFGHHRISIVYENDDPFLLKQYRTQEFNYDLFSLGKQSESEKNYIESTPTQSIVSKNPFTIQNNNKKQLISFNSKSKIDLKLSLDKNQYELNDPATLLITSKLLNSVGFVFFIKNNDIIDKYPIEISTSQETQFKFKIQEKYLFNTSIVCYLQGRLPIKLNKKTISRLTNQYQTIDLNVNFKSLKNLNIKFEDLKKFQTPSQESKLTLNITRNSDNGQQLVPMENSQVTMVIVDQSVIDLKNYSIKNPMQTFYNSSPLSFFGDTVRSSSNLDQTMHKLIDDIMKKLDDEESSDSSDESDGDMMDFNDNSQFEIYVNYFSGRSIMLKVTPSTTISKIKELISERDGLPDINQRLFYLNKQLDQGTCRDYSIKSGSQLKLVIRLFGGGNATDSLPTDDKVIDNAPKIIRVRDNFNPLALFSTKVTDKNGNVTFDYKLPDNLTCYKVMVLASHRDGLFGTTEETFTSTLPILCRANAPRFLNYNDECTFPITISNVLDFDLNFEGAIRSDYCKILGNQGYKCKLSSNSRIIFPCNAKAIVPSTISTFQFVAKTQLQFDESQELCDAISFKIPIHSASSLESVTINNALDQVELNQELSSHTLKFNNWKELNQDLGGLNISLNTDPLQKISTSLKDLLNYEFYCSEQISSKLISLYIFNKCPTILNQKDISQFKLESNETILKTMNDMISTLKKRMTSKYGFRYWDEKGSKDYEYVTMYVYWILHQISDLLPEAKSIVSSYFARYISLEKVFDFDKTEYKESREHYLFKKSTSCFYYGAILNKHPNEEFVYKLLKKAKKHLPSIKYHQLFINLSTFLRNDKYYSQITNYLNVTGILAHLDFSFNTIYGFNSTCRNQAILILSLLEDNKHTQLLHKLVNGLSFYASKDGYYYSTQDNAFNLITIYQYHIKKFKNNKLPDNLSLSIQLNNNYLEKSEILLSNPKLLNNNSDNSIVKSSNNISTVPTKFEIFLPFKQLLKNQSDLIIEKKSKGILYYTLNLSYASLNPIVEAVVNRGFSITRKYQPVSNSDDVIYLNETNGNPVGNGQVKPNIQIKIGSKIKISLTIKLDSNSTFIAIKDSLPAGLEPIQDQSKYFGYWSSQVNNRENGIEIFSDLLFKGTYHYTYYAIAITPGLFIAPPIRIEEMYCKASFGRSKTDFVLIK